MKKTLKSCFLILKSYFLILKSSSGFTLMEILIAIALLGFLVALGLPNFKSSQQRSRDIRRKSNLRAISQALETYYNDKGKYPNATLAGKIRGCAPDDNTVCEWEEKFYDKNGTVYMIKLPGDPAGGRKYFYDVGPQNQSYQLYARLENTLDIDLIIDAEQDPMVYTNTSCSSTLACNYGVASSNIKLTDEGHDLASE